MVFNILLVFIMAYSYVGILLLKTYLILLFVYVFVLIFFCFNFFFLQQPRHRYPCDLQAAKFLRLSERLLADLPLFGEFERRATAFLSVKVIKFALNFSFL